MSDPNSLFPLRRARPRPRGPSGRRVTRPINRILAGGATAADEDPPEVQVWSIGKRPAGPMDDAGLPSG
jgi:hypothetical protein